MFPDTSKELVLSATRECSFYPIIYIMRDIYKKEVSVSQIKETIKNTYIKKYINLYFNKILILLKKHQIMNHVILLIKGQHIGLVWTI